MVKAAGLDLHGPDKVTLHTLRHTRGDLDDAGGVPIWEAAGFLGMTVKTLEQSMVTTAPTTRNKSRECRRSEHPFCAVSVPRLTAKSWLITMIELIMRLARATNCTAGPSFGAVVGDGIVDLRPRLAATPRLIEVFRAQALDQAKAAAAGVRPDVPLAEVELLPPLAAPEKILCIGINYANRGADYNVTEQPEISEHVLSRAEFAGRARAAPDPAEDLRTARL